MATWLEDSSRRTGSAPTDDLSLKHALVTEDLHTQVTPKVYWDKTCPAEANVSAEIICRLDRELYSPNLSATKRSQLKPLTVQSTVHVLVASTLGGRSAVAADMEGLP